MYVYKFTVSIRIGVCPRWLEQIYKIQYIIYKPWSTELDQINNAISNFITGRINLSTRRSTIIWKIRTLLTTRITQIWPIFVCKTVCNRSLWIISLLSMNDSTTYTIDWKNYTKKICFFFSGRITNPNIENRLNILDNSA